MDSILMPTEIEFFVETMQPHSMDSIGSSSWIEWHERLQKVNQEAVIEAAMMKEEFVKESLVTFAKIPVLVHEAILINIWKQKIMPLLLKMEPEPENTFLIYTILYHEAICIALLELVMFHSGAAEALEDSSNDLLDYIYGAISQLLVIEQKEPEPGERRRMEILRQRDDLAFDIGIRSLTVVRYLADNLDRLPLSITAGMFSVHDVPVLLVEVLLLKPWVKDNTQYAGGSWATWDGESLGKVEAQVWLTLRQLLLDPSCPTHYHLTESRRTQLLKLQPFLTPVLLDQLSPLIELAQWLCKLALYEQASSANKPLLLESVLEIKSKILSENDGKWKRLAKEQLPVIFNKNHEQLVEIAQKLNQAYNTDLLENFEIKSNTCVECGKEAIQRCSRCKNQWYCSRNCQVINWPQHKDLCVDPHDTK